jgi:shikimate kinase
MQTNCFLVGPRASGKTSLGRVLAERLNARLVDTDALVRERAGQSIAALVKEQGWERFRGLEHDVLARICARRDQVVATGGGVVLMPANRKLMRENGVVLYLHADVDTLVERLHREPLDEQRPALTALQAREEVEQTMQEREIVYRECANKVLDARKPLGDLAEEAEAFLETLARRGALPGQGSEQ